MLSKKKVKGKWQYFNGKARITEYEYILKTEAELEPEEIPADIEVDLEQEDV